MEGSFVKLKIAEKEERLKIDLEKKIPKPVNGIVQKDGKYYLVRLEMELEKLKSLINEAESDRRLSQITEEASGKIRNAIGKAQLLITKKFKQFEELCRDNIEDNPDKRQNEMETKSSDLQGYWEMMFTQIDDVKALFSHIEELKANNWKSKEDVPETQKKNNATSSTVEKAKSPKGSDDSSPRVRKAVKIKTNDEKGKREARSRLAAIKKQAKLRQKQQQQEEENLDSYTIQINGCINEPSVDNTLNDNESSELSENGSLNSSFNADASLNSSLNSSLEGLSDNICETNNFTPPTEES